MTIEYIIIIIEYLRAFFSTNSTAHSTRKAYLFKKMPPANPACSPAMMFQWCTGLQSVSSFASEQMSFKAPSLPGGGKKKLGPPRGPALKDAAPQKSATAAAAAAAAPHAEPKEAAAKDAPPPSKQADSEKSGSSSAGAGAGADAGPAGGPGGSDAPPPVPYEPPSWASSPKESTHFEILKNGVIV